MGKPRTPNQKKAYREHAQRLEKYVAQVQSVYDALCGRAASIVEATGYDGEGEFLFADYAGIERKLKEMMTQWVRELTFVVHSGTSEEWKQSNMIQDLLAKKVLKSYRAQVDGQKTKVYYQPNSDALKAFQERADRGLNLSERIWNQSPSVMRELECTISTAVEKGFSAVTLSKRLSKYLNDFPTMQKDYAEKYGHAADCHDCEYNSIRLARTEINMAYRTAEQKRWQQFDFVTGYEIKLSGSHPKEDICDFLQGKYPKDFVWTGWHPSCLCMALPIIMSEDDYWKMRDGEPVDDASVKEVPGKVHEWVSDNSERLERAAERGTLPYWLRDNPSLLEGVTAKRVEPALREIVEEADYSDIKEKVAMLTTPHQQHTYVAFDPFSPVIIEKMRELHDLKSKMRLFESIIEDERAAILNETGNAKTVVFPGHKGSQHETWKGIQQMAKDLNRNDGSVAFLPELERETSADALILFKGRPTVADFKYCVTTKANTLARNLEDGFRQAGTVVVKLENMDAGVLKDAIGYLVRNEIPYGNIKVINKHGKTMEIAYIDIRKGNYLKMIKGFLK